MTHLGKLLALSVILSGCAADEPDLGAVQEAIGESTCETAPKDASRIPVFALSCAAGSGLYTDSNSTSYGSGGCPHQFLVGYGSLSGPFDTARGWARWADPLPGNQGDCERSRLAVSLFLQEEGTLDWTTTSSTVAGVWNGTACSFAGGRQTSVDLPHPPQGALKSRVAVSAWTNPDPSCTPLCLRAYHQVSDSLVDMDCVY